MKCLQTVARKRRSFPSQLQRLQRPKKPMSNLKLLQARCSTRQGLEVRLVDNTYVVCKDGRMIIPKPLQRRAVLWYHHYQQYPGHTRLEETIKGTMFWKGMRTSIRSLTKSCRACQVNKKWKLNYGRLPPKTVITVTWRALCVDLIGPYTLKGKDGTIIDFMALTMMPESV